jgi:hypothetical protein
MAALTIQAAERFAITRYCTAKITLTMDSGARFFKIGFTNQAVYAFGSIHYLRHIEIRRCG